MQSLPFQSFAGFSDRYKAGVHYYSQNMKSSMGGLVPAWLQVSSASSATLTELGLVSWIVQAKQTSSTLFATDGVDIFKKAGINAWALGRTPTYAPLGLVADQKNRLLYVSGRYLGMYDGSTWTDNWKDFGATQSPTYMPADTYESDVLIGRGNLVCRLATTDDSFTADSAPAFSLPSGFEIRAMKSGKNGILIGANLNSRSVLVLWDDYSDRSVTPWIWLNTSIQSIVPYGDNWLVITTDEILLTNGYTTQHFAYAHNNYIGSVSSGFSVLPQGAVVVKDKLILANKNANLDRSKPGIYILDLNTKLWSYAPGFNVQSYTLDVGAMFYDPADNIYFGLSSNTSGSTRYHIALFIQSVPSTCNYITEPLGTGLNQQTAEGVKLVLGASQDGLSGSNLFTFNVSVYLYDLHRQLWQYAQVKADSSIGQGSLIKIDGTTANYAEAEVGDEVTFIDGRNAGETRWIASISNQGTANELWTVNAPFTNLPKLGEFLNLSPFKWLGTNSVSSATKVTDMWFPCRQKIQGKRFMVKVVFDNISYVVPELQAGELLVSDKGTFTA